jgi:hypothetical protein
MRIVKSKQSLFPFWGQAFFCGIFGGVRVPVKGGRLGVPGTVVLGCTRYIEGGLYQVQWCWFVPGTVVLVCTRYIVVGLYRVQGCWFVPGTRVLICTRYVEGGLYQVQGC